MLARRIFSSAVSGGVGGSSTIPIPRQAIRTATTWASASTPSSISSKPQSQSQSSQSQTQSPSGSSKGRAKPHRTSVQVRPRPHQSPTSSSFFTPTSSTNDYSFSSSSPPTTRKTQGRRRRLSSFSTPKSSTPQSFTSSNGGLGRIKILSQTSMQCQIPQAKDYSFRPIALYPEPLHLHLAFTPSHQPIMANLGTKRYHNPPSKRTLSTLLANSDTPFDKPKPPSPIKSLLRKDKEQILPSGLPILPSSTALTDHLKVTSALRHPSLHHHLFTPPTGPSSEESEIALLRMMAESDVKHQLQAEWAFESVLAKLGDKDALETKAIKEGEVKSVSGLEGEKELLDDALKGLEGVLAKLHIAESDKGRKVSVGDGGMKVEVKVIRIGEGEGEGGVLDMGDLGIMLDSVKRKRKKKISKHKYQKRRKATRAQRKRLGK